MVESRAAALWSRRVRYSLFAAFVLAVFLVDLLNGWGPRYAVLALTVPPLAHLLGEIVFLVRRAPRGRTFEVLGRILRVVFQAAALQALVFPAAWSACQDLRYRNAFTSDAQVFEDHGPGVRPRYHVAWTAVRLEPLAVLERSFRGMRVGVFRVLLEGLAPEEGSMGTTGDTSRLGDADVSVVRIVGREADGGTFVQETVAFTHRSRGGKWIQNDEVVTVASLPELLRTRIDAARTCRLELTWLRVAPALRGRTFDLVLEGGP
ncbi:MAG: hypothetical protein H6833_06175 [Planctomycetes bacterium]|nr:hypothetical protein [Planctomycetota bacterium]